ncbi:hypothetical protein Tco_1507541 [Tanacetum coccineum]
MLPQCNDLNMEPSDIVGHVKMAFDPTKSPHYKVVHATVISDDDFVSSIQIHTYSSQTCNWSSSFCSDPIPMPPFLHLEDGIYGNNGIHWLTSFVTECSHYKFNPEWFIGTGIGCIALGEREEDSFMVLGFNGKVIQYKIVSKTSRELPAWSMFMSNCVLHSYDTMSRSASSIGKEA